MVRTLSLATLGRLPRSPISIGTLGRLSRTTQSIVFSGFKKRKRLLDRIRRDDDEFIQSLDQIMKVVDA